MAYYSANQGKSGPIEVGEIADMLHGELANFNDPDTIEYEKRRDQSISIFWFNGYFDLSQAELDKLKELVPAAQFKQKVTAERPGEIIDAETASALFPGCLQKTYTATEPGFSSIEYYEFWVDTDNNLWCDDYGAETNDYAKMWDQKNKKWINSYQIECMKLTESPAPTIAPPKPGTKPAQVPTKPAQPIKHPNPFRRKTPNPAHKPAPEKAYELQAQKLAASVLARCRATESQCPTQQCEDPDAERTEVHIGQELLALAKQNGSEQGGEWSEVQRLAQELVDMHK